MILDALGILSEAQDLLDGAEDSTNVIGSQADGSGVDFTHLEDVWLTVDTETVAGGGSSSTYEVALVVAQEATLDNILQVVSVKITGLTDTRIATAGNRILEVNLGSLLQNFDISTYEFVGLIYTLVNGNGTASLSCNAAMSTGRPRTPDNRQVTRSPVGLPG